MKIKEYKFYGYPKQTGVKYSHVFVTTESSNGATHNLSFTLENLKEFIKTLLKIQNEFEKLK